MAATGDLLKAFLKAGDGSREPVYLVEDCGNNLGMPDEMQRKSKSEEIES